MANIFQRVSRALAVGATVQIYGREAEKKRILDFLSSNEPVLHIVGKPGTGKTSTVKAVLSGMAYKHLNYCHEHSMAKAVHASSEDIIVIDEYDRYFVEKKAECMRVIVHLRKQNKKLITIGNNLRMNGLKFLPYTAADIQSILTDKIQSEIGTESGAALLDAASLQYIAKRFDRMGDLRAVFKYVQDILACPRLSCPIRLADLVRLNNTQNIEGHGANRHREKTVHQNIIERIREDTGETESEYSRYLRECNSLQLSALNRQEFDMLFKMGH